jgi:hypothetical protein
MNHDIAYIEAENLPLSSPQTHQKNGDNYGRRVKKYPLPTRLKCLKI